MPRRRGASLFPAILLLLLLLVAAAEPMELYFSRSELARVAGYGEEPVSSVSVAGQVACQLCLRPGSDLLTFDLPASDSAIIATTDEYGNFSIDLPSRLHATPDLEKACAVRVLQLPADTSCRLRHRPGAAYGLRLLPSEGDGARAYTAGVIKLQSGDTPPDECVGVESVAAERR